MWLLIVALFVVLLTLWYRSNTKNYGMFLRSGILEPPKCFPLGSYNNWKVMTGQKPFFANLDEYYKEYSRKNSAIGIFALSRYRFLS